MAERARRAKAKYVHRWWEGDTRRKASFDLKGDRDDFVRELRRLQQSRGIIDVGRDVTLGEWVEDFWRLHAIPNLEASTRRRYKQQWGKHIGPRLASYSLRALNARVIGRQLVEPMRRQGAGDPTIRDVLAVLQSMLGLALAEGRVDVNAAALVRRPPQHVTREVAPIPPERVERLRAQWGARDAMMATLLAYLGVRPQELLALEVEDFGPEVVRIRRKNVDGNLLNYTKTRRNRTAPLFAVVREDLRDYKLAAGIRSGLLFPTRAGTPWRDHDFRNWRRRVFQDPDTLQAVGLASNAVPYDLRAASVTLQAWAGRTMLEVARNHGHSVEICDRHYAGIFELVDPSKRTDEDTAIRAARRKISGAQTLFAEEPTR